MGYVMVNSKIQKNLDRIIEFTSAKKTGKEKSWQGHCPAHNDNDPSLSICIGNKDGIVLKCHAGCNVRDIVRSMGMELGDLFPDEVFKKSARPKSTITLQLLADHKKIPIDKLIKWGCETITTSRGNYVLIKYFGMDGKPLPLTRKRYGLSGHESCWGDGDKPQPYGLNYIKGFKSGGKLILVEGESDTWTLWNSGFPAVGIPGADMGKKITAEMLFDIREIYYFHEPDSGGDRFRDGIQKQLKKLGWPGVLYRVHLDGYKDPNELHKAVSQEEFIRIFQAALDVKEIIEFRDLKPKKEKKNREHKERGAEVILRLAEGMELFHTEDQRTYAKVVRDGHTEVMSILGSGFNYWMSLLYYRELGSAPSKEAINGAINTLSGKALFESPLDRAWIRVGEYQGKIYLDLCNEKWEVIEIDEEGWRVIPNSPINFRRGKSMMPLPYPVKSDERRIFELSNLINVQSDDEVLLIIFWLSAALRPRGPYTVLNFVGEQGSAKSTMSQLCKQLIDPSSTPLRSLSREERDLMVCANGSWVVCFNNLSGLPVWMSDALCRLSTGGGFGVRENYSNDEEFTFQATRPIILNGIVELTGRPDLMERSIVISLEAIDKSDRRDENAFWKEFDEVHPVLLGGLLDVVSGTMRNLNQVYLPEKPRMADFAIWSTAGEAALNIERGKFLSIYTKNQIEVVESSLDEPMVIFLKLLMEDKDEWEGTANELLGDLEMLPQMNDKIKKSKTWPQNPKALHSQLKRHAPFLRQIGLNITKERSREQRKLKIQKIVDEKLEEEKTENGKTDKKL